jgi:hypothetical protein
MIDWMAFVTVFVVSLVGSVLVVALYSFGIRFLAIPARPAVMEDGSLSPQGPSRDDEDDDVDDQGRPRWATAAAYLCFALASACVLFGIYLIVPALQG